MSQEPEVNVQKKILEAKRDQYRAQGYEHSLNARLARKMGWHKQAEEAAKNSQECYKLAALCDDELRALPEPAKEEEP